VLINNAALNGCTIPRYADRLPSRNLPCTITLLKLGKGIRQFTGKTTTR